jgi:tripartite-type tricarboxylate transporter receptor subunit TctC
MRGSQPQSRSIEMDHALSRRQLAAAFAAQAQAYPGKPIRFIVPYVAGGTTDLVARLVGEKVGARLGQPVVIESRPGAGGNIGMDAVAKSAPDGYTIGFGAISTNALNPHIYKSVPFDPRKDFTAISLLGTSTIVLEVGPKLPVKTVAEFIARAKAEPGLQYGTTQLTHVAYRGSAPGINDLLGGHLGAMFDNLPASLPHIQAGKLTALAVASAARSPALPDVPTIAEAGLPGYAVEPWFGVYGPGGLPQPIVEALNAAFVEALGAPEVKDKLSQAGFNPKSSSAAELATLTASEYEKFGKIAREAKITIE